MSVKEDYKIADIDLHVLGRHEIRLAEHEMPGLVAYDSTNCCSHRNIGGSWC